MRRIVGRGLSAAVFALAVVWTAAAEARQVVSFPHAEPGTIVIRNSERALYLGVGNGQAIRYAIAVGRAGKQWTGHTHVANMVVNPMWQPPAIVRRDMPHLPVVVPPGPANPLGTRAIVLAREEIAIHGTNQPRSIGRAASYGCIRMHNRDVEDLFSRIRLGTRVMVID